MKRRTVSGLSAVALALVTAGCQSDAEGRDPLVLVRDSAGITIVENTSPDDSASNVWWRLEGPDLSIGGIDAQEPYALFRVTDALRLNDGRIAVASNGSDDIRFFGPDGGHVRTSGRMGGGPGEYQNPSALFRGTADSLLVADATARRVSVLDPAGQFVRVFNIGEAAVVPRIVGRFADGSLLSAPIVVNPETTMGGSGEDVTRPPFTLVRIDAGGAVADTLGEFPGREQLVRISSSGGQITSINILFLPFGKSPTFAVHGDEVHVGAQDDPEIRAYGMDGGLRRIVRTGRTPDAITERHLDALFERQLAAMPEELRAERQAAGRSDLPHGPFVPPYGEITTDLTGNLWVADYPDPTKPAGGWTIYDPEGRVLARLIVPERFSPFDIGDDWVLGRELDEFDVEHVRLYRIAK
jgi:hypothetical protein